MSESVDFSVTSHDPKYFGYDNDTMLVTLEWTLKGLEMSEDQEPYIAKGDFLVASIETPDPPVFYLDEKID